VYGVAIAALAKDDQIVVRTKHKRVTLKPLAAVVSDGRVAAVIVVMSVSPRLKKVEERSRGGSPPSRVPWLPQVRCVYGNSGHSDSQPQGSTTFHRLAGQLAPMPDYFSGLPVEGGGGF
jgi:hypothetical protein